MVQIDGVVCITSQRGFPQRRLEFEHFLEISPISTEVIGTASAVTRSVPSSPLLTGSPLTRLTVELPIRSGAHRATKNPPAAINAMPASAVASSFSPQIPQANDATITTLSLSTDATDAVGPNFNARK